MFDMIYYHQEIEFTIAAYAPNPNYGKEFVDVESVRSFQNGKICPEYLFHCKEKENKYPEINIYYGPYECNRVIKYRPEKLSGLISCLEMLSYNVKLIPYSFLNTVEIVSMGYGIYRFDIRYLKFNMPCKDDPICLKIVGIIKEAVQRLYGEKNYTVERGKKAEALRRGTTMSVSSKISLSEYDTLLEITDF